MTVATSLSVQERMAVQDLVGRYCWHIDEGEGAEWAALFTPDGIFEGTRPAPVVGTENLEKVPGELQGYFSGRIRHQSGNLVVDPGDDALHSTARFYNQVTVWHEKAPVLFMLGISTASLVRASVEEDWKIAHMGIRVLS